MTDFREPSCGNAFAHAPPPDKNEHTVKDVILCKGLWRKKNHTKELIQSRQRERERENRGRLGK